MTWRGFLVQISFFLFHVLLFSVAHAGPIPERYSGPLDFLGMALFHTKMERSVPILAHERNIQSARDALRREPDRFRASLGLQVESSKEEVVQLKGELAWRLSNVLNESVVRIEFRNLTADFGIEDWDRLRELLDQEYGSIFGVKFRSIRKEKFELAAALVRMDAFIAEARRSGERYPTGFTSGLLSKFDELTTEFKEFGKGASHFSRSMARKIKASSKNRCLESEVFVLGEDRCLPINRVLETSESLKRIILTANGEGIAHAYCAPPKKGRSVTIVDVHVSPIFQSQGLGKKLMRAVIEECSAMRPRSLLRLEVDKTNVPAIKTYSAVGFEIEKDTRDSSGYVMMRRTRREL